MQGLYREILVRYFSVHTEQARLIKGLLYGLIGTYTWNKQDMYIWNAY
jgi:hypothetical protein